jgi:hypothetical protein
VVGLKFDEGVRRSHKQMVEAVVVANSGDFDDGEDIQHILVSLESSSSIVTGELLAEGRA